MKIEQDKVADENLQVARECLRDPNMDKKKVGLTNCHGQDDQPEGNISKDIQK